MIKLKILSVGKTKETWLEEAINEYIKRLSPWVSFEFLWAKDDQHLIQLIEKEPYCLCLDPKGEQLTSEKFADFLHSNIEKSGSRLSFVIGGPEGLPNELKGKYPLISFSKLTFTHQIVRLILIEQVYRAFTILKNIPYHK